MPPDVWALYEAMLRSRLIEREVTRLWEQGMIAGEMHLGLGEEAICAGIVSQLQGGDALALDHRGTPALLMRGVNPVALPREFLGREDGVCRGRGGHMHLFSPELLAASTGLVAATGPVAAGFALAAQDLRPGRVANAFFGEGAMNDGALLEAMNLAVVWRLPVLFVCRDNGWSITTHSPSMTGGALVERAHAFGMQALEVDGTDVIAVHDAAKTCLQRARRGAGPSFVLATCVHLEGHNPGEQAARTGRVVVIDEDYLGFGLSGEVAARLLESGIRPRFARVATEATIPYARHLESEVLPNTIRILEACRQVLVA